MLHFIAFTNFKEKFDEIYAIKAYNKAINQRVRQRQIMIRRASGKNTNTKPEGEIFRKKIK